MPGITPEEQARLLGPVLKGTSRAFYLTVRVLPGSLRKPVGLAYLLARTADTLADTRSIPTPQRLATLLAFRKQLESQPNELEVEDLVRSVIKDISGAEGDLVRSIPATLAMLNTLGDADRSRVRQVVVTLTQGMEMDLCHFPDNQLAPLETEAHLDRYTYLVAGCVGRFWTEISMAHSSGLEAWDPTVMSEKGVGFGKALQLTNILRDVPKDLCLGRCYLPRDLLEKHGLSPEDLLDPNAGPTTRPLLVWGINRALDHYRDAAEYLIAIPKTHYRLRLAVAWPLLLGLATLAELARNDRWLDPSTRIKVTRGWVYRMMALSTLKILSNTEMSRWIDGLRRQVEVAL